MSSPSLLSVLVSVSRLYVLDLRPRPPSSVLRPRLSVFRSPLASQLSTCSRLSVLDLRPGHSALASRSLVSVLASRYSTFNNRRLSVDVSPSIVSPSLIFVSSSLHLLLSFLASPPPSLRLSFTSSLLGTRFSVVSLRPCLLVVVSP